MADTGGDVLAETLAAFEDVASPCTPLTTSEVAEALSVTRRSAYSRLDRLAERGDLHTKKVGAKGRIWWRTPSDGRGPSDGALPAEVDSGEMFSRFVDGVPGMVYRRRGDRLTFASDDCADLTGYDRAALEGGDVTWAGDVVHPSDADEVHRSPGNDGRFDTTYRIRTAGGETRWVRDRGYDAGDGVVEGIVTEATGRRRTERETREEVFERIDDAFFAVDGEWRLTYVNDRAAALVDRDPSDLVGQVVWDEFEQARGTTFQRELARAMETQEAVSFEGYYPPLSAWFSVSAYPSETGLSVYYRDVTERKERERELERYERIIESLPVGVYRTTAGPEGEFVEANAAMADIFDADSIDELLECSVSDLCPDPEGCTRFSDLLERDGVVRNHELRQTSLDGEQRWISVTAIRTEEDGQVYFDGVVRDVTERRRRQRRLEESEGQYRTLAEHFPDGAVALFDEDLEYTLVAGELVDELELDPDATVGSEVGDPYLPEEVGNDWREHARLALAGEASTFETEWRNRTLEVRVIPVRDDDGSVFAGMGVCRDVTDQRAYEATLHGLYRTTRELFRAESTDAVADVVVDAAAEALDLPGAVVYEYDADDGVLRPSGRSEGSAFLPSDLPTVPADRDSLVGRAFVDDETRHYGDVRDAPGLAADSADVEMRSGVFAPIGEHGVLIVGSRDPGVFDERTERLVDLLAANAAAAFDEVEREQSIENQRRQLAALNDLNRVVQDIAEAVVDQSTREEILRVTCDRLADAYEFAWMADVDPHTDEVYPLVESGADDYLETVELSTDTDEAVGRGPAGESFRTGELRVSRDVFDDPAFEPWRDRAEEYGFRSFAAIPIAHGETLYGVIGVHSAREGAFAASERDVIDTVGEVVGHAIASTERKQALMSDEVIELVFRIEDVFDRVDVPDTDGEIVIEEAVPLEDDDFLVYGAVTDDAVPTLRAIPGLLGHWESVTVLESDGGRDRFELRLTEPPVLSTVTAHGGEVVDAVIADGDYTMTVQVPPSVEVRDVIDTVEEAYPAAEMLTRRQVEHDASREQVQRAVTEDLTDRQRAALRASYYAGFFEWPREASGEDVAESLDISSPTFHQHLRKAQQKLLDIVLT
ncbi:PAS domain-containing protein [Halomicrobium salinisoli]|uniref:PAS domain-containing protein n=1 Tax=Halomicrobium salinisoli TaxID=2878391 RepID=UPI001CF06CCF|nr:PAS domain-containing protein [Halomicrobium salinisoli]